MLFWIIAAVMLLLVFAILLPALLRQAERAQGDTKPHNVIIARERLTELESELAADTISPEIFDLTKQELELGLLEDVAVEETGTSASVKLFDRLGLIVVLLLIPAITIGTYLALGAPEHLNVKGPGLRSPQATSGSAPTMEELVARLEQKVAANPQDPEGLFMLGRVYSSLGRYAEAAKALEDLRPLVDDHPAVLVALADALAMENAGTVSGRPYELVRQVLDKKPEDVTALWLAGKGAMEQADYQNAIYYWRQAEAGLGGNAEMLKEMQDLISQLLQSAKAAGVTLDDPGSMVTAVTERGIQLSVALAAELQAKLTGNEHLFIFAKAVSGSPMPLAAIKRSAAELPLALALDDSAMLQGGKLTDHNQLKIVARITRGGDPVAKTGDLQSAEIIFNPAIDQTVELLIDRVVR